MNKLSCLAAVLAIAGAMGANVQGAELEGEDNRGESGEPQGDHREVLERGQGGGKHRLPGLQTAHGLLDRLNFGCGLLDKG